MAKKKQQPNTFESYLTSKDVLIAYCSTLSEERCKKAYILLKDEFEIDRTKYIRLNSNCVQDDSGLLRIKKSQFDRILKEYGEYKLHWLIKYMYSYLDYLQSQIEIGDLRAKRQFNRYTKNSIYQYLKKGWLIDKYMQEARPPLTVISPNTTDFYSISNEKDAIKYIQQLPPELMDVSSPEVEFLSTKYPGVLAYIREELNG